jgi:hypothetical protein
MLKNSRSWLKSIDDWQRPKKNMPSSERTNCGLLVEPEPPDQQGSGLFIIGAAITLMTGRSVWFSGVRQVLFGLAATVVTLGIGHIVGVSIGG